MKRAAVATLNAMWKSGGRLGEIGLPRLQMVRDRVQEWRDQQHADQPVDEIAQRKTIAGGIVATRAFENRIDSAAEIGAEHQRQRRIRRNEMRIGERHYQ